MEKGESVEEERRRSTRAGGQGPVFSSVFFSDLSVPVKHSRLVLVSSSAHWESLDRYASLGFG